MLELRRGAVRARLSAERGAILTSLEVDGRELLFLDEATFLDPSKNVRGGVPVLFPSPGKPGPGRYALAQHGFARNLPWMVVEQGAESATLRLESTAQTRAQYPHDFALTFRSSLTDRGVRIDQHVESEGPWALGFHPYFLVRDKSTARVPTRATRAWDNVQSREVPLRGPIDFTQGEVDLHLEDHGGSEAVLDADGARILVRASPEFWRWVLWTLPGRDFVCVEPWTAAGNALNTGEHVLTGTRDLFVELEASRG